jgi:GTPase SAR1 family protein
MIAPSFEIKVCLIGHVSVGKSTVLNALLCSKYSEMAMRRATAGVNYFRVSPTLPDDSESTGANNSSGKSNVDGKGNVKSTSSKNNSKKNWWWSTTPDEVKSPEEIFNEIKDDNQALRNSTSVSEKYFDVEVKQEIFQMRGDTRLVIVDIPGINEAGASTKYKDYIKDKWNTFDCVVLVMDAKQGVNTEDQLQLLQSVQTYTDTLKDLPVIIVANKVDEPDDEEQAAMLADLCATVEKVFKVSSREKALATMIQEASSKATKKTAQQQQKAKSQMFPAVVYLSAIHAFIYRTTSLMTYDVFKKFDDKLIQKIGREEVGKTRWNRLSQEQKHKAAFDIISDPTFYNDGLSASNFDTFLRVLSFAVGGKDTQLVLLRKQVEIKMSQIDYNGCLVAYLEPLVADIKKIGLSNQNTLQYYFWIYLQNSKKRALDGFINPSNIDKLAIVMNQLKVYQEKAVDEQDRERVLQEMKSIVTAHFEKMITMFRQWCSIKGNQKDLPWSWIVLSPNEWLIILNSVLAVSHTKAMMEFFGSEMMFFDIARGMCGTFIQDTDRACYLCPRPSMSQSTGYYDGYGGYSSRQTYQCCSTRYSSSNSPEFCPSHTTTQLDTVTGFCQSCSVNYRRPSLRVHTWISGSSWNYNGGKFTECTNTVLPLTNPPSSFNNSKHFGHLAWVYSNAYDIVKGSVSKSTTTK